MTQIKRFPKWGLVVFLVCIGGIAIFLQTHNYTFTDNDIKDIFGAQVYRLTIESRDGERLCWGRSVNGLRKKMASEPLQSGQSEMILAVGPFEGDTFSVASKIVPPVINRDITYGAGRLRVKNVKTNAVTQSLTTDQDGSVWFAAWTETIDGVDNPVRFGFGKNKPIFFVVDTQDIFDRIKPFVIGPSL